MSFQSNFTLFFKTRLSLLVSTFMRRGVQGRYTILTYQGIIANTGLLCSLSDTVTGTEEGRELQQIAWKEIVGELKRRFPSLEQLV